MSVFIFDIETIPDISLAKQLYQLPLAMSDDDVLQIMRVQQNNQEFAPLYLHRVITISVVLHTIDKVKIWSLSEDELNEEAIISRFFQGIEKFTPVLVTWNGCQFDLPVLHYRALKYGIQASRYWELGEEDSSFRWNNYISRYHFRHLDLMDVLSGYQSRAKASLMNVALMLGLPGKLGMDGSEVFYHFQQGAVAEIRQYCEIDVINTYLIYLRFEMMRGKLTPDQCNHFYERLRSYLVEANQPHFSEFLSKWHFKPALG